MVFKRSDLSYLKNLTSKRDRNKEDIKKLLIYMNRERYQEGTPLNY